jgi:hypothetical protein
VNVALCFIAQSEAEREIGAHAPLVTGEDPGIHLMHAQSGDPGALAKLRGASTEGTDLQGRVVELLEKQSTAVALNRGDECELRLAAGTGDFLILRVEDGLQLAPAEGESSVEILRRNAAVRLAAQADSKAPGVQAFHYGRVVLQLEVVSAYRKCGTVFPPLLKDCSTWTVGARLLEISCMALR